MGVKTFAELRKESIPYFEKLIADLEHKLSCTGKTVRRKALIKEIQYWQAQIDMADSLSSSHSFSERYPNWMPKHW